MDFNSRGFHLAAVLLFAAMAVFAFDSWTRGLPANLIVGVMCCLGLFALIVMTSVTPTRSTLEPQGAQPNSSEDLRVLLDQIPTPLVRLVDGNSPEALNRAARSLFQTDEIIVSGGEELARAIAAPLAGGSPILKVLDRQYTISVTDIISEEGRSCVATLTDVQMEMNKAEAAALKETLHILSHEIMNSLVPVASLADIADSYLAQEVPEVPSAREALEMISRRAGNLTRFIEAYRSVARLPEPALQSVDPKRLVEDLVAVFERSAGVAGVAFELHTDQLLPRISIDEAQVSQAIINVITNAVEATETVNVQRRVRVQASHIQQAIVITISDNGEGVAETIRENLFSAFATTKEKGTGTGLNLARQIALAHGGNLRLLDERPDDLTSFAFNFPVQARNVSH